MRSEEKRNARRLTFSPHSSLLTAIGLERSRPRRYSPRRTEPWNKACLFRRPLIHRVAGARTPGNHTLSPGAENDHAQGHVVLPGRRSGGLLRPRGRGLRLAKSRFAGRSVGHERGPSRRGPFGDRRRGPGDSARPGAGRGTVGPAGRARAAGLCFANCRRPSRRSFRRSSSTTRKTSTSRPAPAPKPSRPPPPRRTSRSPAHGSMILTGIGRRIDGDARIEPASGPPMMPRFADEAGSAPIMPRCIDDDSTPSMPPAEDDGPVGRRICTDPPPGRGGSVSSQDRRT